MAAERLVWAEHCRVAEQPYGQIMLGVVATGLAMYGLFSFVEVRYRRLTHD